MGQWDAVETEGHPLRVSRFSILLVPISPIAFSPNKGATLRGGFGHALKEVTCTVPHTPCSDCRLRRICPYPSLFETPLPENAPRMPKGKAIPRPFILEPPPGDQIEYRPGERLTVGLVLIGQAIDRFPYFTLAFEALGQRGIGRGRGRFRVEAVKPVPPDLASPSVCRRLALTFLTPTRIIEEGRPARTVDFSLFFETLARRLDNLAAFHGLPGARLCNGALRSRAKEIRTVRSDLRWVDQERYSRRQGRSIPQGGWVGAIVFEGELTPFLPYLWLGEQVHVGKGATFGMGRYEVDLVDG